MSFRDNRRDGRSGFLLVEAVIAAAIMALLVGAALSLVNRSMVLQRDRAERAWMSELARSLAEEQIVTGALGDHAASAERWGWEVAERRFSDPDAPMGEEPLVELSVDVWPEGERGRAVRLTSLMRP